MTMNSVDCLCLPDDQLIVATGGSQPLQAFNLRRLGGGDGLIDVHEVSGSQGQMTQSGGFGLTNLLWHPDS